MSLSNADLTSVGNALKKLYPKDEAKAALYDAVPLFGMLEKKDIFEGDGTLNVTVMSGGQQGVATNLADAISNKSSNVYQRFAVTRGRIYGVGGITREAILAGRSNKGSVIRTLQTEQKQLMRAMKRHLSNFMWGNGGGAFGQIATGGIAGSTIQLADKRQVVWFEVDQVLQLSAADGTSGVTRAGTLQVSAVNRRDGILTFTGGVVAGVAAAAALDYVFVRGNHGATAGNAVITGVSGWIPDNNPIATAFFGVDRSADPTRLGGIRYAAAGIPIEEALQEAMSVAAIEGMEGGTGFLNPYDYGQLLISMGSNRAAVMGVQRSSHDIATVGYKGVKLQSPFGTGEVEFFADHGVPVGKCYILNLDDWYVPTLGDPVDYIQDDGLVMLRAATADSFEWRLGGYLNAVCENPGNSMVITGL